MTPFRQELEALLDKYETGNPDFRLAGRVRGAIKADDQVEFNRENHIIETFPPQIVRAFAERVAP